MVKIILILLSLVSCYLLFIYMKKEIKKDYLVMILFCFPFLILAVSFFKHITLINELYNFFVFFIATIIFITMARISKTFSDEHQLITSRLLKIDFVKKWHKHIIVLLYLGLQIHFILTGTKIF